jgi:hypothetical protein
LPYVVDHLWQSCLFAGAMWGLAALMRGNLAALRLWLWRSAALKFLLPFGLLFALGEWMGFPVRHSAIAPPVALVDAVTWGLPLASPAQMRSPSIYWLGAGAVLLLLAVGSLAARIFREERHARWQRNDEQARIDIHWSDRAPPPGFFKTALLTSVVILTLGAPLVAGAVTDRLWRQQVLVGDIRSLRSPGIEMVEADPHAGLRFRVVARRDAVSIQNINIQDLVALVYGIDQFEVFGGALPWLASPRYDVKVSGTLRAPEAFDPYALRLPVTEYLADRFGVSIRVNGSCQEPCLNQQSFTIERLR